ncbi:hypothetical protein CR973_01095 [Candidatus Saccharibacteria bacterium]|nr:MAG: hypothetical protein CR973_01095 [Candidatus Saccharibacteria bacterium]
MYNEAEAQIASFVDKAAKLASSSKKTYAACGYGSEKFSKGPLSCTVGAVLTYRAAEEASIINTVEQAKSLEKNLGWSNMLDTTAGSQEYTSKNYIRTSVYDKGDLSCSVDYRYKENDRGEKITIHNKSILLVEVGCTGLALKEHF